MEFIENTYTTYVKEYLVKKEENGPIIGKVFQDFDVENTSEGYDISPGFWQYSYKIGITEHNGYGFETKELAAEAMITSFKDDVVTYLGEV